MTPEQRDVLSRYWSSQKATIQAILADKSRFFDRMSSFEWRVDSKMEGEKPEPTAVLQMTIGAEKCHFEMSAEQLDDMIASLSEVKAALEETAAGK